MRMLDAACAAAEHAVPFDRTSLTRLRATGEPTWDVWQRRAAFVSSVRGERAVPVFGRSTTRACWSDSCPNGNTFGRGRSASVPPLPSIVICSSGAQCAPSRCRRGARVGRRSMSTPWSRACRRGALLLGAVARPAKACPAIVRSRRGADRIVRTWVSTAKPRDRALARSHLLMAECDPAISDASVADNVAAATRDRAVAPALSADDRRLGRRAGRVEPVKIRSCGILREAHTRSAQRGESGCGSRGAFPEHLGEGAGSSSRGYQAMCPRVRRRRMCARGAAALPTVRCERVDGSHTRLPSSPTTAGCLTHARCARVCRLDVLEAACSVRPTVTRSTCSRRRPVRSRRRRRGVTKRSSRRPAGRPAVRVDERRRAYGTRARAVPMRIDVTPRNPRPTPSSRFTPTTPVCSTAWRRPLPTRLDVRMSCDFGQAGRRRVLCAGFERARSRTPGGRNASRVVDRMTG